MGAPGLAAAQSDDGAKAGEISDIVVTARKSSEKVQDIPISIAAFSQETLEQRGVKETADIARITPGLSSSTGAFDGSGVAFNLRGQSGAGGYSESSVGVYVDGVYRQSTNGLNGALFDLDRVEVLKGPQGTLYGKNTSGGVINLITKKPELDVVSGYATGSSGLYVSSDVPNVSAQRLEGALNLPLGDKAAVRLAGNYFHNAGYGRDGTNRPLNNHKDWFLRGHLLYEPSDSWQILLSADYAQFRSNGYLRTMSEAFAGPLPIAVGVEAGLINPIDIPSAGNGGVPGPTFISGLPAAIAIVGRDITDGEFYRSNGTSELFTNQNVGGVSLTIDGDLSDDVHIKSITAYRGLKNLTADDNDGTPYHQFEYTFSNHSDFYSQEVNLSGSLMDKKLEWLVGGFYSNFSDLRGDIPGIGSRALTALSGAVVYFKTDATSESMGAFGHAVYNLTDALSVTAGLRWSKDKRGAVPMDGILTLDGSTLIACQLPGATVANECKSDKLTGSNSGISYEGAVNYKFNPDVMAYFTTRRGFRAGDFNSFGNYIFYNPEVVTDYEIGLKSTLFDHKVRMNIAAYWTDYKDIQRSTTVIQSLPGGNSTAVTATYNAAKATIKGIEADITVRPTRGLNLNANYTYTDAGYNEFLEPTAVPGVFNDRSNEVFDVPKHIVNASATYGLDLSSGDRIDFNAGVRWQSDLIFGGSIALLPSEQILRQNAYALVDARITYNIVASDFSIALFSRNLTNKRYYIGAGALRPLGASFLVPGEPRFIGLELSKKF